MKEKKNLPLLFTAWMENNTFTSYLLYQIFHLRPSDKDEYILWHYTECTVPPTRIFYENNSRSKTKQREKVFGI